MDGFLEIRQGFMPAKHEAIKYQSKVRGILSGRLESGIERGRRINRKHDFILLICFLRSKTAET